MDTPIIRVHLDSEDRYTSLQLTDSMTADDICRFAVQKLVGSTAETKDFALFLSTKSAEMKGKERRFAGFEVPTMVVKASNSSFDLRFSIQSLLKVPPSPPQQSQLQTYAFTPVKEGPLKLKGKRRFKDRYFVLARTHILYAHSQKAIGEVNAVVNLEDVTVCPVNEATFGKFTFELITHVKIFILKAENAEEKNRWMRAIADQIATLVTAKGIKKLNEQVRAAEIARAERDISLIETCSDFEALLSHPASKDLFLSFISPAKRNLLRLLEDYKAMCAQDVEAALKVAQKVVTELIGSRKRGEAVVREELVAEKLQKFFHFYDQRQSISNADLEEMATLFDDVFTEVMQEVRDVEYPQVLSTPEFRNGVLKLPAAKLLAPFSIKVQRETSASHRKSRSFFLPST